MTTCSPLSTKCQRQRRSRFRWHRKDVPRYPFEPFCDVDFKGMGQKQHIFHCWHFVRQIDEIASASHRQRMCGVAIKVSQRQVTTICAPRRHKHLHSPIACSQPQFTLTIVPRQLSFWIHLVQHTLNGAPREPAQNTVLRHKPQRIAACHRLCAAGNHHFSDEPRLAPCAIRALRQRHDALCCENIDRITSKSSRVDGTARCSKRQNATSAHLGTPLRHQWVAHSAHHYCTLRW